MPTRAPKPCRICGVLVYDGSVHCPVHPKRQRPGYDDQRLSSSKRGYDRKWSRIRAAKLKLNPWCEGDHAYPVRAQVVDHKIPLSEGGSNESFNLQSLCNSCHNKKHKRGFIQGGRGD